MYCKEHLPKKKNGLKRDPYMKIGLKRLVDGIIILKIFHSCCVVGYTVFNMLIIYQSEEAIQLKLQWVEKVCQFQA